LTKPCWLCLGRGFFVPVAHETGHVETCPECHGAKTVPDPEVTAIRKAFADAPHDEYCAYCNCWKSTFLLESLIARLMVAENECVQCQDIIKSVLALEAAENQLAQLREDKARLDQLDSLCVGPRDFYKIEHCKIYSKTSYFAVVVVIWRNGIRIEAEGDGASLMDAAAEAIDDAMKENRNE
jgi:hypothetical protein